MITGKQILSGDTLIVGPNKVKQDKMSTYGLSFKKTPEYRGNYSNVTDGRLAKVLESITEEEREAAEFEAKEYTYQVLNYAEKDELDQESLRRLKAFHHFAKHGVKTGYSVRRDNKLLSADIFYILLSEHSVAKLAKTFNVSISLISQIKSGEHPAYRYEHTLVKNIRSIVSKNFRRANVNGRVPSSIFRLCKLKPDGTFEILYHCKSKQVACGLRKSLLGEEEWKKMEKKKTLDIRYPIQEVLLAT